MPSHTDAPAVQPRQLAPGYAVAPQIRPADMAALAAAGFGTVICNRPDGENPPELATAAMRAAAEAAGLSFVENPLAPGGLSEEVVARQRAAIDAAPGAVLAYCASGNRSSILWALAMAGRRSSDELIAAGARHGYQLAGLKPQLDALAAEGAAAGPATAG